MMSTSSSIRSRWVWTLRMQMRIVVRPSTMVLDSDMATYQHLGSERWSPAVVNAMAENYREAGRFNCGEARVVMVPK